MTGCSIKVGDQYVGDGHPCYIIAEAGCNHNQSPQIARALIDSAVAAGASAVKFQTYISESMYSRQTPMLEHFRTRMGLGEGATMFDLIKMTELPFEMHDDIVSYSKEKNIPFFSTPFDRKSLDFLDQYDVPMYKIASFEMTHFPLLRAVAEKQKPIVLSTGMCNLGDIEKALDVITSENNEQIILLHCVSSYPAKPEEYNLRVIETLKSAFSYPVGLSDHTPGTEVSKIAVAIGANMVEKHITIDQSLPGPDHYFSLTPEELEDLVSGIREVEKMLGSARKRCVQGEKTLKHIARRSLVAATNLKKGDTVEAGMIDVKRPGYGLHPELMESLIGAQVVRDVKEDEPLSWDMFMAYPN